MKDNYWKTDVKESDRKSELYAALKKYKAAEKAAVELDTAKKLARTEYKKLGNNPLEKQTAPIFDELDNNVLNLKKATEAANLISINYEMLKKYDTDLKPLPGLRDYAEKYVRKYVKEVGVA